MHPFLAEADPETLAAFRAACEDIAEQIYKTATPANFENMVYMAADKWIQDKGEKVIDYTPEMRVKLRAVVLDALASAFGYEISELPPLAEIPPTTH